jgi:hypothetical protein
MYTDIFILLKNVSVENINLYASNENVSGIKNIGLFNNSISVAKEPETI